MDWKSLHEIYHSIFQKQSPALHFVRRWQIHARLNGKNLKAMSKKMQDDFYNI